MNNNYPSKDVRRLLGWTEFTYYQFQYETGLAYLDKYIPHDPAGIDIIVRSKMFWNWWKNHWAIRDEQFLEMMQNNNSDAEELYINMHHPELLTQTIYPNASVLEESYAQMIGNIINAK